MDKKNARDVTPDDFDPIDGLPYAPLGDANDTGSTGTSGSTVAGVNGASTSDSSAALTGKAAPTEVFPDASTQTASLDPTPSTVDTYDTVPDETAEPEATEPPARRGTMDFGLLLLRLVLGGWLIIESVATLFRLGGSEGISGLRDAFSDYAFAGGLSVVVPVLQLTAGVFLVLGLLSPIASMVAVVVTAFMAVHGIVDGTDSWNVFAWEADVWLPILLFGLALGLQFTGPGFYGVDATRSWARRPLGWAWTCALLGLIIAGLVWWFGTGINPVA